MQNSPQAPDATPKPVPAKKTYHRPDLRDFGTVKELTLTGGLNGPIDSQLQVDYATGGRGTIG